jgi:fatty acid desaturase
MWVVVALACGFVALFTVGSALPWPVTIAVGAVLGAWHGSLQHEVIHGLPTSSRRLNHALVWLPLGLTYPFLRYDVTHVEHHMTGQLTVPGADPESTFVTAELWARIGPTRRAWLWVHRTIAGRMVLGPARTTVLMLAHELRLLGRREPGVAHAWMHHLVGVAVVGGLVYLSPLTWWEYVMGVGYGGLSLTMLRSFAEHLDVTDGTRTAYVEAGRFFSLLYLNNNLHQAHHEQPDLAWHQLPAAGRASAAAERSARGAGHYPGGYRELFTRYLFRPLHHPVNVFTAAHAR